MSPVDPTPEPTPAALLKRRALKLGLLASAFALIGHATARAQDALTIESDGATIYAKYINFKHRLGALITLFNPGYEIGIQPSTFYTRSAKNFAWYKGGKYTDKELDSGGGDKMMSLGDDGLTVSKGVEAESAKLTGGVTTGSLTSNGTVKINGHDALQFGADLKREESAGQIAYQKHSSGALDILGAGTEANNRKIEMWAEGGATIHGPVTVLGGLEVKRGGQNAVIAAGGTEALRMVRGVVLSAGGARAGKGFSSRKVNAGVYDITFDPPFADLPGASVTQIFRDKKANPFEPPPGNPGSTLDNATIVYLAKDKMRVATGNNGGGREDRDFSFIVMGPL